MEFSDRFLVTASFCKENPENPDQCVVVTILQVDMKGNIPAWVLNRAGADHVESTKQLMKVHVSLALKNDLYDKYDFDPAKKV